MHICFISANKLSLSYYFELSLDQFLFEVTQSYHRIILTYGHISVFGALITASFTAAIDFFIFLCDKIKANGKMWTCRDASLQFRVSVELVLGLAMVLGLAHFTFCHTSSPQKPHPRKPAFYHSPKLTLYNHRLVFYILAEELPNIGE